MNRIMLGLAVLLFSFQLLADIVEIPASVKEIKSATYSTGGGKSHIVYVKVLCVEGNGADVLYMAKKMPASAILGFSRFAIPDSIEFRRVDGLVGKIVWKG